MTTRYPSAPIFLLGDFNLPSIDWSLPASPNSNSSTCQEFIDLCSCFNFTQIVTEPTRVTDTTANILDLILCSSPELCSEITYLPGLSDHFVLNFSIAIARKKTPRKTKTLRNYHRADFSKINNELSHFLTTFLEGYDLRSVEDNWSLFKLKISELTNRFIPIRKISYNPKAPWYNSHIRRLSNRKKRLYRLAKTLHSQLRWSLYRSANQAYIAAVKSAKKMFLTKTLPHMLIENPRKFWNVINPADTSKIVLTNPNGEAIPDNKCSTVLNNVFSSHFTQSFSAILPHYCALNYLPMYPVVINPEGICKIIDNMKSFSAVGIDSVSTKFLKSTKVYSSIILSKIFQQSLDNGTMPAEWKTGKVIPAHKSGNKHSPLNYRPISITSIPCKIIEHILFSHIANFLESNSFFHPAQHGFRKSYSCETQLLLFTHRLHEILDRRSIADCIFLDFAKAFDKVCHRLLLLKLRMIGIDTNVLRWLECFLTGRQQFVTANDTNSCLHPVVSGVPQGTVLGPLLFLIFINDLPNYVTSCIHLFADDCVLYRELTTEADARAIQTDINNISSWCQTWQMTLNVKKCKFMRITRSTCNLPTYYLNSVALESVTSYKYLGIHIASNLTWKTHVEFIVHKANRMLGYIKRNFHSAPADTKLLLYKSLVRSQLEYASSIWDPGTNDLINQIEKIQNNAARFILSNYNRTSSISAMKSNLNLVPLTFRRKLARLCLFHKIFHHDVLRDQLLLPPSYLSSRLDHPHKVGTITCNTNTFSDSFIPRTSIDWNRLPSSIAMIAQPSLFQSALRNM